MITEVDLAKTMQCLMRNALRRSIWPLCHLVNAVFRYTRAVFTALTL